MVHEDMMRPGHCVLCFLQWFEIVGRMDIQPVTKPMLLIYPKVLLMMMIMSGFVERVIHSRQTCRTGGGRN